MNNCDDIAINVVASYYYPEFHSLYVPRHDSTMAQRSPAKGRQSSEEEHYRKRNWCLKKFSEILGINALKLVYDKYEDEKLRRFDYPLRNRSIYEKRQVLEKYLIEDGHLEKLKVIEEW